MYLIILCPQCSRASAAREGAKTHSCPYCGSTMRTDKAKVIARARNGREARKIVVEINARGGDIR